MPFELIEPQIAKITSVTNRIEKHGDEDVPAISIGFKIEAANTILDLIHPSIRPPLYKAVEGQDQLPGVEPSTPLLRTRAFSKCDLSGAFEGWTLEIDHGIDEDDPITLGDVKVDKLRVEPKEGGSVILALRTGTSDVTAEDAGLLWSKNGQEVSITLTAPKTAGAQVIDGSVAAFEADHPLLDKEAVQQDATDLFVAEHGDDE